MEELYKLKKMLCDELEEYGRKGEMSTGSLEIVDKLAHSIKNIEKIIDNYEEEDGSYRNSYDDNSYDYRGNRSYRNSYRDGRGSYDRGSYSRRRRDSRGRYMSNDGYSRHGDAVEQLRDMMAEMPDEQTRNELQRIVSKMENM